jgi:RNA polymerase sigma-70 factor, ECF subfamily
MRTALNFKTVPDMEQTRPAAGGDLPPRTGDPSCGSTVTPICAPALGVLYRKYAPAIQAQCRRFLPSAAAAHDATHEAFVRVLSKGVVLPGQEVDAVRYLCRVSINVCLNLIRHDKTQGRAAPGLAALNESHSSSAEPDLASRELVQALLARCKAGDARVAIMHYVDGIPQVEIAKILGITRRSVFNRLRNVKRIANELVAVPAEGSRPTHSAPGQLASA